MEDILYKKLAPLVILYGCVVSLLYLFGYWGAFKINIMEFIGLQDFAKLSLYPLAGAFISLLIGVALAKLFTFKELPPGGASDSGFRQFGLKHWRILVALNLVLIVLIIVFVPYESKWIVIASLISLLSVPICHLEYFISAIPNSKIRATILFLLLLLGGIAFAHGKIEAELIKTKGARQVVDVDRSKLKLKSNNQNPVSFLGYLAGYFVLYESATQNIVFIKGSDSIQIFFHENEKRS